MSHHMPDRIERVATASLVPYARNARTHSDAQVGQIAASITEFGFTNPVLIDEHGTIIAGHGRVLAAKLLGLAEVPCIRLSHLSDTQRRAYVIADNKLALNAGWDESLLSEELRNLADAGFCAEMLGFSDDEIGELFAAEALPESPSDPDAVPARLQNTVSQLGDVWVMGNHRLLCGDSTQSESYSRLLDKMGSVDVVWTDPPYNVAYTGSAGSIANDDMSDSAFEKLLRSAFCCIAAAMRPGDRSMLRMPREATDRPLSDKLFVLLASISRSV